MSYRPTVSIIIPCYNEREDIRLSLDAAVGMDYPDKEIIVVDDSTDDTPEIIKEYKKHGVRLIRRESRSNGCCGARNLGIKEAKGEIIMLLNADVFPGKDFIERILPHYERGVDYLLVNQKAANSEYLFPRFIESEGELSYDGQDWIEWSEGFSCRREAALDVGLIPGDYPLPFCRDWLLGKKLGEKYKKAIDRTIVVPHISPHTFRDFWRVRKNRGRFAFLCNHFMGTFPMKKVMRGEPFESTLKKLPFNILVLRTALKTVKKFGEIALIFPALLRSVRIANRSPRGALDIFPFFWAYAIENAAFTAGEWSAFLDVKRARAK